MEPRRTTRGRGERRGIGVVRPIRSVFVPGLVRGVMGAVFEGARCVEMGGCCGTRPLTLLAPLNASQAVPLPQGARDDTEFFASHGVPLLPLREKVPEGRMRGMSRLGTVNGGLPQFVIWRVADCLAL